MKKGIAVLAILGSIMIWPSGHAMAESLLSLHVGAFSPGGDLKDSSADGGGDFGIFYTYAGGSIGFEAGMHGYGSSVGSTEIGVVGLELLITFQDPMATVQPYAGLGVGTYNIEIDPPGSAPDASEDGFGFVAEAGLRVYISDLFLGFQVKMFTNEFDAGGSGNELDYGGTSLNLILGTIF